MPPTMAMPFGRATKQPSIKSAIPIRKDDTKPLIKPTTKPLTKPTTKPPRFKTDHLRLKDSQADNADLTRKLNEEKAHSLDLEKQIAALRETNAEIAGLALKRLRERVETLEPQLKLEKLRIIGYELLQKHVERDVRKCWEEFSLPDKKMPNFELWSDEPETGFKMPKMKHDPVISMRRPGHGGQAINGKGEYGLFGAGSKRKHGEGSDGEDGEEDELLASKRRNIANWQRAQEDVDMDDEEDEEESKFVDLT